MSVRKTVSSRKVKLRKCSIAAVLIAIMTVCTWPVSSIAASTTIDYIAGHPVYEDNLLKGTEITQNEAPENIREKRSGVIPDKYDPRETGGVTGHIEDQGFYNTCWAFSTVAAMECNLIKNGYEDTNVNLSENFLAYFFYNRQTDPLGETAGDKNLALDTTWDQNGGSIQATANFLTTWAGISKDTESTGEIYEPEELPQEDSYDTEYHVKDVYFYDYSVDNVKRAILEHGAVVSGIFLEEEYWNLDNASYYCTEDTGNHAVAIVGWDDSYSRDNFNEYCRPENDGAWIVRNSYGDAESYEDYDDGYDYSYLKDGYIYVSYEDASLDEITAFELIEASEDCDYNYQYDGSGNPVVYDDIDNNEKIANTFVAQGSEDGYNEMLKAVSVEVFSTWTQYNVEIYGGLTSDAAPDEGTLIASQSGVLKDAGSQRIELENPVELIGGEQYAVVFSFDGDDPVVAAFDCSMDADWIAFENEAEKYQSYCSEDSRWYDLADTDEAVVYNVRIKAYTDDTERKTSFTLNKTSLTLKAGGTENLSAAIEPAGISRAIRWSSSDESVASVDDGGEITAVGPGKAVITAAIGDMTVSCDVTVYGDSVNTDNEEPVAGDTSNGAQDTQTGDSMKFTAVFIAVLSLAVFVCIWISGRRKSL